MEQQEEGEEDEHQMMFSDDDNRQMLMQGDFPQPQLVSPFPDPDPHPIPIPIPIPIPPSAAGLAFPHPHHQPPALPQKLRPIRRTINGPDSPDHLGFLGNGNGFQPPPPLADDEELLKIKSEMDTNLISSLHSHFSHFNNTLPFSFNSSSDGSGDSSAGMPNNRERNNKKKKKRKKLECFLESLLGRVMKKQEQMHQQLIDLIERKERERIAREEAWRKHEMERAKRDEQLRSQEAARSLTLISFIRNALGHENIHIPPHPLPSETEDCENPSLGDQAEDPSKLDDDPNNRKWSTAEVQALITVRTALDHKFRALGSKVPVWEELSAAMAKMGYLRNARKCKEKWENINKYFKKATGNGKARSDNAKTCPYFHELETLYRNQLITTAKACSPTPSDGHVKQNGTH